MRFRTEEYHAHRAAPFISGSRPESRFAPLVENVVGVRTNVESRALSQINITRFTSGNDDSWKTEGRIRAANRYRAHRMGVFLRRILPFAKKVALMEAVGLGLMQYSGLGALFAYAYVGLTGTALGLTLGTGVAALGVGYLLWQGGKALTRRLRAFGQRQDALVERSVERDYGPF